MTEEFKDSATQEVSKTLLIALAGTTGSGKTESGLLICRGIAGENFSVIDSENKRALNKKTRYRFQHLDMQAPYSPEHYKALIEKSIKAGHRAIMLDNFSSEWEDEGGLHDDANAALERMSRGDAEKAKAVLGLAWKEPKMRHKALMRYLVKLEIPVVFCLRAEPKIKYIKEYDDKKGREITKVVDAGWLPIAEKLFGYQMLVYALMMPENPGVPVHLKKLEPEFEAMFPLGKQITEESGRMLAAWASGATKTVAAQVSSNAGLDQRTGHKPSDGGPALEAPAPAAAYITPDQVMQLETALQDAGITIEKFKKRAKLERLALMTAERFEPALKWIEEQRT